MRNLVRLRGKIEEMEKRYDAKFQIVFDAIKRMLQAPKPAEYAIGFHAAKARKSKNASQAALRPARKNARPASPR